MPSRGIRCKNLIAVGKRDGGVWLRDALTGQELRQAPLGAIKLSFAPDVGWLAIIDADRGLHIWDVVNETAPVAVATGRDVRFAVFLRATQPPATMDKGEGVRRLRRRHESNPKVLATADDSGRVRLWRTTASRSPAAAVRPAWSADSCMEVADLAASNNGLLVAAGCKDGRIFVWRTESGAIAANIAYPAQLAALAFAPDGHTIIVAGKAGLQSFVINTADLVGETCRRLARNLSLAEWTRDVGRDRCRRTCPTLPGCD